MAMEKYDYQVQLIVTDHIPMKRAGSFSSITKQIPTFILPSMLGLTTFESAQKTCYEMFEKYELHGSLMNYLGEVFTF